MTTHFKREELERLAKLAGLPSPPKPERKVGLIQGLCLLPFAVLPKWYYGLTAIAGFAAMIAPLYLSYLPALPWYLAFLPFYAPFIPSAIAIGGILALVCVLFLIVGIVYAVEGIANLFKR